MKYCIFIIISILLIACENPLASYNSKAKQVIFSFEENVHHGDSFTIMYIDENLELKTTFFSSNQGITVTLPIQTNFFTPIMIFSSNIDTSPKGCIYPISTTIDTHGGFVAWIFYRLFASSFEDKTQTHSFLTYFNWERLVHHIQKYDNPWVLNQDLLIENIADRTFNVYSIKEK